MWIRSQNKISICNLDNIDCITNSYNLNLKDNRIELSAFNQKKQYLDTTKQKNVPLRFWMKFAVITNLMKAEFSRCRRYDSCFAGIGF